LYISGLSIRGYDELALARVQRTGVDTLLIRPIAYGQVNEVVSIRQKLGPALRSFTLR
jgi:hypothetical protein